MPLGIYSNRYYRYYIIIGIYSNRQKAQALNKHQRRFFMQFTTSMKLGTVTHGARCASQHLAMALISAG